MSETIADKLAYLLETKEEIKQAIINKGVEVDDDASFRSYADKIELIKGQKEEDKEALWYGVEWDTKISSPTLTRIGNTDLHKSLPVQSLMRGCIVNNYGAIVKYLNSSNWTQEIRDGSQGDVMVEIPKHYRKFESEGTVRRVKISTEHLEGFNLVKKYYISAYEASIDRNSNTLHSIINTSIDYRGGNNDKGLDDTPRSLLGRPVTNLTRSSLRTAAQNKGVNWSILTYEAYKTIYYLYIIEYASFNSQLAFNAQPTATGLKQGGLGMGVTTLSSNDWSTYNNYNPFVPCGHTDSLGNHSGVVNYNMSYTINTSSIYTVTVPRYRGIENIFGHIWKWLDGINVKVHTSNDPIEVYTCNIIEAFYDDGYANYSKIGNITAGNYIKEIMFKYFGDIVPTAIGGSSSTYMCDKAYNAYSQNTEVLRGAVIGGSAYSNYDAGLLLWRFNSVPSDTNASFGTRICYLP